MMKACLLIGLYRRDKMMLNPVGAEAGPLCEGDELILLSQTLPDLSEPKPARFPIASARTMPLNYSACGG